MRRFVQKHKRWAVDERCQCGHPKARHGGLDIEVRFRRHGCVFEGEQQTG